MKLVVQGHSLCFENCHLAAHEAQKFLDRRNSDVRNAKTTSLHLHLCSYEYVYVHQCAEILNGARVGQKALTLDHQFDHAFWFGDMNYRIDLSYTESNKERLRDHEMAWQMAHELVEKKVSIFLQHHTEQCI